MSSLLKERGTSNCAQCGERLGERRRAMVNLGLGYGLVDRMEGA